MLAALDLLFAGEPCSAIYLVAVFPFLRKPQHDPVALGTGSVDRIQNAETSDYKYALIYE